MTPHIAMSGHVVCALAGPQKPDNSRHSGAVTCPAVPIAVKSFSLDDQHWCSVYAGYESMHLITTYKFFNFTAHGFPSVYNDFVLVITRASAGLT